MYLLQFDTPRLCRTSLLSPYVSMCVSHHGLQWSVTWWWWSWWKLSMCYNFPNDRWLMVTGTDGWMDGDRWWIDIAPNFRHVVRWWWLFNVRVEEEIKGQSLLFSGKQLKEVVEERKCKCHPMGGGQIITGCRKFVCILVDIFNRLKVWWHNISNFLVNDFNREAIDINLFFQLSTLCCCYCLLIFQWNREI